MALAQQFQEHGPSDSVTLAYQNRNFLWILIMIPILGFMGALEKIGSGGLR